MAMEEGLDTGRCLLEKRLTIAPAPRTPSTLHFRSHKLHQRALVAACLLIEKAEWPECTERWRGFEVRPSQRQRVAYAACGQKDFRTTEASALTLHSPGDGAVSRSAQLHGGSGLKGCLAAEPLVAQGVVDQLQQQGAAQLAQAWKTGTPRSAPR